MSKLGHNERSAMADIRNGQAQAANGWLMVGRAMSEAKSLFANQTEFNRWFRSQNFGITIGQRDAAIWAASNKNAFDQGRREGHGNTPQAALKWWNRHLREDSRDYIYVMANAAMPGLVKIGMTKCDPEIRAKQLSENSGVPIPFAVSAVFRSSSAKAVEVLTHKSLSDHRISSSREFFKVSEFHACKAIAAAIEEVEAK